MADELEAQDLDFKQWDATSRDKAVKTAVQMAVCMVNGGGGTVVFGIADHIKGRNRAILGVPPEINTDILKKAVYEQTDPRIMPVFEELKVKEGTGRLLLMQIYPGMPPHTDTAGRATIRVGKECLPLTGTMRRKIAVETGETDYMADTVCPAENGFLSAIAMANIRKMALAERAANDLLSLSDMDLLKALKLIREKELTRAAVFIAGNDDAIRKFLPSYNWTFLQMQSDTDYINRYDAASSIASSVLRIEELIVPFNPVTTYKKGMFHFEYRVWPEIAIRESLMNAFCHADFRIPGPIMIKIYPNSLEISNNGNFIAGITPENILHHQPAARNPLLVDALTQLRLVNRSNLGIGRMYSSLLMEGKEPPNIQEIGNSVKVSFFKRELNPAFRTFIANESERGQDLAVDEMLLLLYLLQHHEIDTATAMRVCQRNETDIHELTSTMEKKGYMERGGSGRGLYWNIRSKLYLSLSEITDGESRKRIDWEAAKTRILSILKERAKHGEKGLNNKEIRQITKYDRNHAYRLMAELRAENTDLHIINKGRYSMYVLANAFEH
jgi:ATP-dependent DNA helicase RecG